MRQVNAQCGIALVTSLLLLLVVTIFALSMFRSYGVQEKIAGNVREKQRALQAAESAQSLAEWWLAGGSSNVNAPVVCGGAPQNVTSVAGNGLIQVCSNALHNAASANWPTGFLYSPGGQMNNGLNTDPSYFALPQFYISDTGAGAAGGEVYRVNALGYGGTANAVAVVESTISMTTKVKDLGGQ